MPLKEKLIAKGVTVNEDAKLNECIDLVDEISGENYENGDNLTYGFETYTVDFNTGSGSTIESIIVNEGSTITLPDNPTLDGYVFDGWYIDESLTTLFDENTPITNNMTLYAKWEIASLGYNISIKTSDIDLQGSGYCFYSLDNGSTWTDFWSVSNYGSFTNPILTNVSQIKFKISTSARTRKANIYSNILNVDILIEMAIDTVESDNYTLTQDVDDLVLYGGYAM